MIRKKAREGYMLVLKTDDCVTITPAVSAPDDTDLTGWEELPEAEVRELEREFNEKVNRTM